MRKMVFWGVLLMVLTLQAQRNDVNFFEPNGIITNSPMLSNDLSYSITHLDHRADDVVWAHVVYSIIDLRDIRNSQLAFPTGQDVQFKNLFKMLCDAVVAKVPVYYPNDAGISPYFDKSNIIPIDKLADVFFIETNVAGAQFIDPLFELNAATGALNISGRIYSRFSTGIRKFIVQKVYYFDKHLSTMGSKVIGIAPMLSETEPAFESFDVNENAETDQSTQTLKNTLRESIIGWFLYDDLEALFSSQLIYQESNVAQRINYHEFFSKRMFTDYLIGDNNLFKRLYGNTEELTLTQLQSEIRRIESEMIKTESEIWAK